MTDQEWKKQRLAKLAESQQQQQQPKPEPRLSAQEAAKICTRPESGRLVEAYSRGELDSRTRERVWYHTEACPKCHTDLWMLSYNKRQGK